MRDRHEPPDHHPVRDPLRGAEGSSRAARQTIGQPIDESLDFYGIKSRAEARDLVRPALRKLPGLTVTEVKTLLNDIAQRDIVLRPGTGSPAPDPGDQLLWDLVAARADLLLIAGDKALQRDAAKQARVPSPQAFIES